MFDYLICGISLTGDQQVMVLWKKNFIGQSRNLDLKNIFTQKYTTICEQQQIKDNSYFLFFPFI